MTTGQAMALQTAAVRKRNGLARAIITRFGIAIACSANVPLSPDRKEQSP